jgi:PAS domain S-box-containing protein
MLSSTFKEMWDTIKSGEVWKGEIQNLKKDGSSYWVYARVEPNYDKNGKIISYTSIRNNITSKKKLEIQNEQNKAIITFASSGIGTIDLDGNFLSVNGAYTKLFGYSQEEMLHKNCADLSHEDYAGFTKNSLKIAKEVGTIAQMEKVCKHKDGHDVYVEISLDLLPDGNSFVAVVNSLEDKKRLESLNKLLEYRIKKEVEKNTKQLKLIQEEQLKSVKLTSIGSLAAGITHEINTPLTYIKGNFEMMKYDISDLPDSDIKSNLLEDSVNITNGIERIANIVESMREVSQTSTEMKEEVDIYKTIVTSLTVGYNRFKQISKIYLNDKEFEIDFDKDEYSFKTIAQKQRIEQVWIVIVNNAMDELIKIDNYDNRSLKINVYEQNNEIICKFKDNAGGIGDLILDRIFEPFVSTKQSGGVGVGLNIAHRIVQDQAGTIEAYNEDDGAVFCVKLKKLEQGK